MRRRRINNKGVLDRPWTKSKVLNDISNTLKFQFTVKGLEVDILMPCTTRSCQSSRTKLRMLRAFLPDTPRPPQFQPELPKNIFCVKLDFSRFTNKCLELQARTFNGRKPRHGQAPMYPKPTLPPLIIDTSLSFHACYIVKI